MNKKILLYISAFIVLLILFAGLGDQILYAKSELKRWIPFLLIVLILPIILSKLLQLYQIRGQANLAYSIGSILIVGPLFGFWLGHLSETELHKNGVETTGVITEKWNSKPKTKSGEWLLKCAFVVDGNQYKTFTKEDKKNLYQVGDSLTILYSPKYPDNNIIVELE